MGKRRQNFSQVTVAMENSWDDDTGIAKPSESNLVKVESKPKT